MEAPQGHFKAKECEVSGCKSEKGPARPIPVPVSEGVPGGGGRGAGGELRPGPRLLRGLRGALGGRRLPPLPRPPRPPRHPPPLPTRPSLPCTAALRVFQRDAEGRVVLGALPARFFGPIRCQGCGATKRADRIRQRLSRPPATPIQLPVGGQLVRGVSEAPLWAVREPGRPPGRAAQPPPLRRPRRRPRRRRHAPGPARSVIPRTCHPIPFHLSDQPSFRQTS